MRKDSKYLKIINAGEYMLKAKLLNLVKEIKHECDTFAVDIADYAIVYFCLQVNVTKLI